jgi:transcriptional regulator with XRE-family HTH domain
MDLAGLLQRIEQRLGELGLTEHDASLASGHPDAIRNIRRALEKGKGAPTVRILTDLARALQTSSAWLLEGQNGKGTPLQQVLAELEAKREAIDTAIRLLKELHHLK